MSTIEFDQLKIQVDRMMQFITHLQKENALLRHKMAVHIQDQTRLHHRTEAAAKQVKQIIKQLKEAVS